MRARNVAYSLAGSLVVFVACASQAPRGTLQGGKDAGGVVDAIANAVVDAAADLGVEVEPVRDARAGPIADEVACSGGYARKAYPGKTLDELASVRALSCRATPDADGYRCGGGAFEVKDGEVRSVCTPGVTSVRFVMP
jgi:hypothetical protein